MKIAVLLCRVLQRAIVPIALLVSAGIVSAVAADGWTGAYGNKSRGDSEDLRIQPDGPGTYKVFASVDTKSPLCSAYLGTASGRLLAGKIVTLPERGETCSLTITTTPAGVSVRESAGCSTYHGAACGFDGEYPRLASANMPAHGPVPAPAPTPAAGGPASAGNWLVGGWVAEGHYCESDAAIRFNRDGSYYSGVEISGRWRLTGASIAMVYTEGDEDSRRGPERRETHAIRQTAANDMMLDRVRYRRCPPSGDAEPWHPEQGGGRAGAASAARGAGANPSRQPTPAVPPRAGAARPDLGRPLSDYTEIYNPAQFNFLFAAVSPRPDFDMLAREYHRLAVGGFMASVDNTPCQGTRGCEMSLWQNSREYDQGTDSFRKHDAYAALQPLLEQRIAPFRAAPLVWFITGGGIDHYDFSRGGFPVAAFKGAFRFGQESMSNDKLFRWINRDQVMFVPVADNTLARAVEGLIASNQIALRVYFVAQSAAPKQRDTLAGLQTNRGRLSISAPGTFDAIDAIVTRVQFVDARGRVLVDYGPNR